MDARSSGKGAPSKNESTADKVDNLAAAAQRDLLAFDLGNQAGSRAPSLRCVNPVAGCPGGCFLPAPLAFLFRAIVFDPF